MPRYLPPEAVVAEAQTLSILDVVEYLGITLEEYHDFWMTPAHSRVTRGRWFMDKLLVLDKPAYEKLHASRFDPEAWDTQRALLSALAYILMA